MTTTFYKTIKSVKFQLAAMLLAACYVVIIFALQYQRNVYPEELPTLLQVDDKIKKLATPVTVGIHINSFPELSFASNDFSIEATVWFRFAKATESLDTLNKFTLHNSKLLGDGSLIYKSPPIIKIHDKDVLVCYHIQADFKANLKQHHFPIGDHRLNFILQNKSVTAQELIFVTDNQNITLSKDLLVSNWKPLKAHASAGYIKSNLHPQDTSAYVSYPCVAFSIDFESIGARLPVSLYFPLFILFFIMLISLLLNITDSNRLSLASAGVPALVLFRLVIDSVSPKAGYITHIDMAYYLIAVLSLFILFFQMYVVLVAQKTEHFAAKEKQHRNERLENLNAQVFLIILIVLVTFLTFYGK